MNFSHFDKYAKISQLTSFLAGKNCKDPVFFRIDMIFGLN